MESCLLRGWLADFEGGFFFPGEVRILDGHIESVRPLGTERLTWEDRQSVSPLILPGLIDAHIHIESSMLVPSRFASEVARYGTVAVVADPHEIANVMGIEGVEFMISEAAKSSIHIFFTVPSCVPATSLETAGARIDAEDMGPLFSHPTVVGLGEVMNYPGVISGDPDVLAKIELARSFGMPVDGHAPGLRGSSLANYAGQGISTDHECSTLEEAIEKIRLGMHILIREGSSARNFDDLAPLIDWFPDQVMLCTDDSHPDDLVRGHIDRLIRRGLARGIDFFKLYRAASINPVKHYHLPVGQLKPGDPADLVLADLTDGFNITSTYIRGKNLIVEELITKSEVEFFPINRFDAEVISEEEIAISGKSGTYRVIQAYDGELITSSEIIEMVDNDDYIKSDTSRDILKIVVINRYAKATPAVGLIRGFGIRSGAIASSIAHDSHNVIAVGVDDCDIVRAINQIIKEKGGIAAVNGDVEAFLPLPVAGLMSRQPAAAVASGYTELTNRVGAMGCRMKSPFMTLSFMALLVIPHLKMSDRGLFNCDTFEFTELRVD